MCESSATTTGSSCMCFTFCFRPSLRQPFLFWYLPRYSSLQLSLAYGISGSCIPFGASLSPSVCLSCASKLLSLIEVDQLE